jgi:hypothetical protein
MISLFRKIIPLQKRLQVKELLSKFLIRDSTFIKKNEILHYYNNKKLIFIDVELNEALKYLAKYPLEVMPYKFIQNYLELCVIVYHDDIIGLKYVIHNGSKLYFKRNMTVEQITFNYRSLLIEQDIESPHRYLTPEFYVKDNKVIYDIGAAEGNFSISVIEKAKHVYIFESDLDWIEALNETFRPWINKVTIINKFVTNRNSSCCISLDKFIENNASPDFIKVDIEGAENDFIEGAIVLLCSSNNLKIVICTYHNQDDYVQFLNFFSRLHFSCSSTRNYMLPYYYNSFKPPFFRKGLLRCEKGEELQ